jgi:sugar phosphate isomerase/epimerase
MQLSFATANLYSLPFEQVLQITAEAGFQNIELDLFWERKEWAVAQHLRGVPVQRVVQLVKQAGLRISSIHDAGGVLEGPGSARGLVNPALDQVLSEMGYAPDCLVFHTPHIEGNPGPGWWERISEEIVCSLAKYRGACAFITIENMPLFDGYFVPLTRPEDLYAFVEKNALGATLDTAHYAQIGMDIAEAARTLGSSMKTVHLSDFKAGKVHVFIGDGELDFAGFFDAIDRQNLNAVTLECSLSSIDRPDHEMSCSELVSRLKEGRARLERFLGGPACKMRQERSYAMNSTSRAEGKAKRPSSILRAQRKKDELIADLVETRRKILDAAVSFSPAAQDQVFLGTWSIKDVLAHLIGWDETNRQAVKAIRSGRLPAFYACIDRDWQTYNARLVSKYRRDSLAGQLSAMQISHQKLVDELQGIPAAEFEQDYGVRFRGCKVTIARLLQAELQDEKVHYTQIERFGEKSAK